MTHAELARLLAVRTDGITFAELAQRIDRNVELVRRVSVSLDHDRRLCNTSHRLLGLTDRPVEQPRRG